MPLTPTRAHGAPGGGARRPAAADEQPCAAGWWMGPKPWYNTMPRTIECMGKRGNKAAARALNTGLWAQMPSAPAARPRTFIVGMCCADGRMRNAPARYVCRLAMPVLPPPPTMRWASTPTSQRQVRASLRPQDASTTQKPDRANNQTTTRVPHALPPPHGPDGDSYLPAGGDETPCKRAGGAQCDEAGKTQ